MERESWDLPPPHTLHPTSLAFIAVEHGVCICGFVVHSYVHQDGSAVLLHRLLRAYIGIILPATFLGMVTLLISPAWLNIVIEALKLWPSRQTHGVSWLWKSFEKFSVHILMTSSRIQQKKNVHSAELLRCLWHYPLISIVINYLWKKSIQNFVNNSLKIWK